MGAHRLWPCSHLSHRKKRLLLRSFGWNLSLRDCRQGTWHHWGPWWHTCTRVSLNSRMPVWFLAALLATCMSWKLIRKKPLFSPGSTIYNIICLCIYKCKKYYMCCTYHINVILIILSWTFNAPPAPLFFLLGTFFSVCLHLFWWAHIGDIDFMALPKWIMQGFQYHRLSEPAVPRPRPMCARLKHLAAKMKMGKVKISTKKKSVYLTFGASKWMV